MSSFRNPFVLTVLGVALSIASCTLITDVDRSKIPNTDGSGGFGGEGVGGSPSSGGMGGDGAAGAPDGSGGTATGGLGGAMGGMGGDDA